MELPTGLEPVYPTYRAGTSPSMLWKLILLNTGFYCETPSLFSPNKVGDAIGSFSIL